MTADTEKICGLVAGDCPNLPSSKKQPVAAAPDLPDIISPIVINGEPHGGKSAACKCFPKDSVLDILIGGLDGPIALKWKSVYDHCSESTGLVPKNLNDWLYSVDLFNKKTAIEEILLGNKKDIPLTESKSRELRGGILYTGCDCEKRNGLQDDCQRTGCHGSPACLTSPPTCPPSQFSNGKHLLKKMKPPKKLGELAFSAMCR